MGHRTIVVLDNDCARELENATGAWVHLVAHNMKGMHTGPGYAPGIEVVAIRHHTDDGLFYFDGRTLRPVDSSELIQCSECGELIPRDLLQAHRGHAHG